MVRLWRDKFRLLVLLAALGAVAIPLTFWIRSANKPSLGARTPSSGVSIPGGHTDESIRAAYGGSESCRECHEEEYELWKKSHHALAERVVDPYRDGKSFNPVRSIPDGAQAANLGWTNSRPEFTGLGQSGQLETQAIARVIGEAPLQQFLVPFPGGRFQALEAAYDPASNDWFNVFGAEHRRPGEWGHWTGRGMNWNSMCATCHNTGLQKNYDKATDSYRTAMAEMSVGCEACHGPLKPHNDWQKQHGKSGLKDPTLLRHTARQTLDYCGSCHARRAELTGNFQPGDSFFDHFSLATLDHTDTFYADGQVRDEDYEFSSFLSSRMHFRGVRCEDCHNPHSAKTILPGNWLCMRCHDGSYTNAPVIKPVAHSHHKVFGYDTNGVLQTIDLMGYNPREIKETGGECVNCHMPKTVYMQRHWRHDHGFTSPDPSLTQQFGIPNACNRCHQDKSTQWALDAYEKWYGAPTNSTRRTRSWLFTRAKRGDADSRDGVLKILETDEIPYWRAAAANLLSPWTSERIVADALLRSLEDTNTLVREAAVRSLAPVLESTGSRSEIEADLKRCLNDPSRNVRIAAALALRTGIAPGSQAGQDLNQFLAFNADQPIGQLQAGLTAQAIGDSQRALGHFQKAVEWDSHSVPLRQQLAVTLSELGRASEAVATLTAAVSLEPDNADLHFQLALAHNETGDIHATAGQLAKAVALNPRHSRAWYNLGLAQNELGNFSVAVESLLQAENLDPSNPTIPYARATILARLDRTTEARAAARRALEIQPSYADARRLLDLLSR